METEQQKWVKKNVVAGLCSCGNTREDLDKKKCKKCREDAINRYHANRDLVLKQKKENRSLHNETRRVRTRRFKDECFSKYGGYRCVCCGETEKLFLDLDHVNNDGSIHRKLLKWNGSEGLYVWIRKNNFPPIFQVLCRNCNWGKYRNGGICPHKTNIKE